MSIFTEFYSHFGLSGIIQVSSVVLDSLSIATYLAWRNL